ncbi:putative acetyltransferase [Aeromonas phage ZPAH34]|uniref:putative acetyltransferase n=1 Tax=Aeromonas phage ZPAH34 TaxID=2924888 RepID=UPI00232968CC|nr:putative acetyltransferase [Aeromonas phage ZPAH34]UOX39455.1 putative acetyltransferase [Aeromonas phage ZPAH34]
MKEQVILAFDMDDTLTNTNKEVQKRALDFCLRNLLVDEAVYIKEHEHLSFGDFNKNVKEIIEREVIEKRVYMDTSEPTDLLFDIKKYLFDFKQQFKGELKIVICTHRGDNIDAWMSTYNYLKKYELETLFDMIHSIDCVINNSKLNYLDRMYPGSKIVLVDDNPFGGKNKIKPFDSRVVVYKEILSYPCRMNQETYDDIFSLMDKVKYLIN